MDIDWRSVNWSGVLPLIAVAFGWLLNELGHIIRLRRDEKRAVGRTLSDLSIMHRHIIALRAMMEKIRAHTNLSPQEQLYMQVIMDALLPVLEGVKERYAESVKVVMGIKPLLGYELAQQTDLLAYVSKFRSLFAAANSEQAATAWLGMSKYLEDTTQLEELITTLARAHSWRTWFEVKRYLKTPLRELPKEVIDMLEHEGANKPTKT